jgi:hypothetical protein
VQAPAFDCLSASLSSPPDTLTSVTMHRKTITAAEMAAMTPQQRAEAVEAGRAKSWDDVPEPFRSEVQATAVELGEQRRRQRA